jgi:DAACS family dicarboxylate/amino acid:cation (Na+ or H+) symporter
MTAQTLTRRILLAMILGIVAGLLLSPAQGVEWVDNLVTGGVLEVVGQIFVAALKMLVIPLVFITLVSGVTKLGTTRALGRIGLKTIGLYLVTTAVALTIALSLATAVSPGKGIEKDLDASFDAEAAPPITEVLINMVPDNPVAAMAEGEMLPVIIFALLFGLAITLTGERGGRVRELFQELNEVMMQMVMMVMRLAPIGVFCLISQTFATEGLSAILALMRYFGTVVAVLLIHAAVTYTLLLQFAGRVNPLAFFRKMRAVQLFAFSTSSSNATIPVTLRTVEHRLGADNSVAAFTVPLGATINMDGTAIMQGVATVFIANVYGVDLAMGQYLMIILTATLASIGTAGVPSVGLIMLAMVLQQVGLPIEAIGMIWGVDRLLDMLRTAVNVTGDATVTTLVAKSEKALDEEVFNDPEAGV